MIESQYYTSCSLPDLRGIPIMQGVTEKMRTRLSNPVQYQLLLNDDSIDLNPYLGKHITLRFTGNIACVHCHKAIKKTFNQFSTR